MEFTINTELKNGVELQLQTAVFQAWFNENIMPQIDFENSCSIRDEYGKPLEWHFPEVKVVAVYFTPEKRPDLILNPNWMYNYNFNKFMIYGAV